jgi:predicted nucleotidyltransferase
VFGSATRGDFDPDRSDVDMVVEFEPLAAGSYADNWFGLREALVEHFGRPVDLVTAGAIRNPYFGEAVERSQQTLYAA